MNDSIIKNFKNLITPFDLGLTKIRVGPKIDSGYVMYKEPLEDSNQIFSFGIGTQVETEKELAEQGKYIYMYDVLDYCANYFHPNFIYSKRFVDSEFLNKELDPIDSNNLTMFMDIEGGEREAILNLKDENLIKFSQISLELHDVTVATDINIQIMNKILKHFDVFHIHANNGPIHSEPYGPESFPSVIELSFLRKDLKLKKNIDNSDYPIDGLDYRNNDDRPDFNKNWFR